MAQKYIAYGIGDLAGKAKRMVSVRSDEKGLETLDGQWATFTPTVTLVGGAGNTVPQYSTNNGRYCRHCDIVFVDVFLDGDGGNEGAGTGVINISLPITSGASINNGDSWFHVGTFRNGTAEYILYGILGTSDSTLSLVYFPLINNVATVTGALQNNTSRFIRLHFWYEVD